MEEADGIQDLDSPAPSPYFLGWDGDAWRGEGADEFGPDTNPSTITADGRMTGIRFSNISNVVADSLRDGSLCTGFVYRRAMTFELEFGAAGGALAELARHRFDASPGFDDIRLVDLGTSAADPTPDGAMEIVQAGEDGRVYVFDGALGDWIDGDADAGTVGVLAIANGPSGPPRWLGAPAIIDIDGGAPEIFLSAEEDIAKRKKDAALKKKENQKSDD